MFEQGQIFADRYQIDELLGEGGFSYVFKAKQLGLGRTVALKIIHARRLSMPLPDSSNQQLDRLHERFEQEAKTISQLASPHTVTLYDYGINSDGCPFMVLEYIDGQDLADVIAYQGKQKPERVISMLRQVLESLAEAHAYGLLHRDIKPANIVMTQDVRGRDQVKLLDFGLAKMFGSDGSDVRRDLTSESQIIGTPRYMSPEQIMTPRDLTAASDLYSLGLVGYELLTGRPAVDGVDTMSLIAAQINDESFLITPQDGVPTSLANVINRMLCKRPSDRFASAEEILAALDAIERGPPVAPPVLRRPDEPTAEYDQSPDASRSIIAVLVAIIALLITGGIVAFAWNQSNGGSAEAAERAGAVEVDGAKAVASKKDAPEDPAPPKADEAEAPAPGGEEAAKADAKADAKDAAEPEVDAPDEAPAEPVKKVEKTKKKPKKTKKSTKSSSKVAAKKAAPTEEKPKAEAKPAKKTKKTPKIDAFIMEP